MGGSGSTGGTGRIAPLPSNDVLDSPSALTAVTLAYTESVVTRLNGDVRRVEAGTVQVLAELISALQFVSSYSKVLVLVLISSLYPLILRPPSSEGKLQLKTTSVLSALIAVVGAIIYDGIVPARTENI